MEDRYEKRPTGPPPVDTLRVANWPGLNSQAIARTVIMAVATTSR